MYYALVGQMKKQLRQMDTWLEKAEAHAKARSYDPGAFVTFRLAPDQLPFSRQVGIACDTAKLGVSRITGKDAPSHADDEKTLAELRARIQSVLGYLEGFSEADFKDSASRSVTQPRWEGRTMTGHDYFLEHVLPNFYFHTAHTYAVLRHGGVDVGKRDYLGPLTQKPAAS